MSVSFFLVSEAVDRIVSLSFEDDIVSDIPDQNIGTEISKQDNVSVNESSSMCIDKIKIQRACIC